MQDMNEFLKTVPFDLYELALFQLVVKHQSFTKAAEAARLTQSAMTRQVQGMENSLGVRLLERTTRQVHLTPAGKFLHQEAARLMGDVDQTLRRLSQDFADARKEVRVAVSQTIGLAYLPGFFHANLRRLPHLGYRVACEASGVILASLEANEQDIGVLCPPARLPGALRITHRFEDAFTLVVPGEWTPRLQVLVGPKAKREWLKRQPWLLIEERSNTGQFLRAWMRREGWGVEPAMQLDSFDLIINLVALGFGASFVPIRALALYNRKRGLARVSLPARFSRELVVVVRKQRTMPEHLRQFITNVLF
jgi:DNA-binding transcriptional LysR family regulator